jgi:hypothetical protein
LASVPASQVSFSFVPAGGAMRYVSIRARNASGTGPYSSPIGFSIPSLAQPGNQVSAAGVLMTPLALTVSDPDGSALTFSHTGLPVGLSINSVTREIIGTPAAAGNYNVTVYVSDNLETVSRSFSWTVTTSSAVSVSPNAGTGSSQTFVAQYSDLLGAMDLDNVRIRFVPTSANGPGGPGACTVEYDPSEAKVSLQNDPATSWFVGALGSGTLSNSQCTINLASSSVSTSGNNLTLKLAVTFAGSFGGAKNIYMLAKTVNGSSTGWQLRGSWTVPAGQGGTPIAVSVSPNTGSGAVQTFAALYSDSAGPSDLDNVRIRIVPTSANGPGGPGACTVQYDPSDASVSLQNDLATSWFVGALGSGTLSNSQCTINLATSSASTSGNNLTLRLSVTFDASFDGKKNIYMLARSNGGTSTGWQLRGSWTVPTGPGGVPSAVSVSPRTGAGSSQTFSALYSASAGASDLDNVRIRFVPTSANGPEGPGACTVQYDPSDASVSLQNDLATSWFVGALGSGTLSNSQCTINLAASSASASGSNLTLTLSVTFKTSFGGDKNIYMLAKSNSGLSSGWKLRGSWTVPVQGGTPYAVSMTPGNVAASKAIVALLYHNTAGATDLESVRVRFSREDGSAWETGANSCTASYNPATNSVSLLNDAATAWLTGTLGTGSLTNSQCKLNLADSSASISGNFLTLNLSVNFKPASSGLNVARMLAKTVGGTSTGWQYRGLWTAP